MSTFHFHVTGAAAAEEETLSAAWCDFETYDGGNDKDNDSRIELKYSVKYGASGITRVVALAPMESHGRFPDGSSKSVGLNSDQISG